MTIASREEDHPWGVSVVIPAYNYDRWLGEAIDSALAQTHAPVEVIVVDDGSPDRTPEVCAAYGERIVYHRQANAGLSAARNTGIRLARYPWVAFLDADDCYEPNFLEVLVSRARSLGPDFGMVAGATRKVDVTGKVELEKGYRGKPVPREVMLGELLVKTRFAASCVLCRTAVLRELGGFDTNLRSTEDRDMWIRVAAKHRVFHDPVPILRMREHGTSMSRNAARMEHHMLAVLDKSRRAGIGPGTASFWRRARAFTLFEVALMYHDQGERHLARRRLLVSMLNWPWFKRPVQENQPPLFRLRALYRTLFRP